MYNFPVFRVGDDPEERITKIKSEVADKAV